MSTNKTSQPASGEEKTASPAAKDRASSEVETELYIPVKTDVVTDVVLANSETAAAPSFPAPAPAPAPALPKDKTPLPLKSPAGNAAPLALLPGARVDDFEIVRMLGRGAFGHVYLARQVSLDRLVALKVSANRGSEGRTMARLEHQHIVQVFSETVDIDFNQRLLCMQLVPGIGLEKLIGAIHARPASEAADVPRDWNGSELLAIIDRAGSLPTALDPSALHDRESLAKMDAVETTAWFGTRLAEALDFAHRHGVLHREIKPANILVNPYGRPMLADFNISSQPAGTDGPGEEMFGGTFAYMAPEHLEAFNPGEQTGHEAVTARSDIYSLGLVLNQLLDGRLAFSLPDRKQNMLQSLQKMTAERRQKRPACREGRPNARKTLERTISRCLEASPEDRFASGAELAEQLDGCLQLRQAERQLPQPPAPLTATLRHPFAWLILLVILPQVAASVLNIAYNLTQIVSVLNPEQKQLFQQLVIGYNLFMYPVAIVMFILVVRPVWRCWNALSGTEPLTDEEVENARLKALRLPYWTALLTGWGWFPGGFLFPLVIKFGSPPLDWHIMAHLVASFYLSGLIALAYSLCGVQFVVLRGFYPSMWRDTRGYHEKARQELAPTAARLNEIQRLAVSIPLMAAFLLLLLGGNSDMTFRILVASLIALGLIGSHMASAVVRGLSQVIVTLTRR